MFVPTRKANIIMPTEIATYVCRVNRSSGRAASVVGQPRPNFGTVLAKVIRAAGAAKLPHLCHFPDSAAPTILRGLQRFDDSMADRLQTRQAS